MGRIDYNRRDRNPGPPDLSCPSCGRDDQVSAVPAVYQRGRGRVRERDHEGHWHTRTVMSPLAQSLRPVPEMKVWPCLLLVLGLPVPFFWLAALGFLVAEPGADSFSVLVLATVFGAVLLGPGVFLIVKHRRAVSGRAGAEALWQRGWYCERCGTVHYVGDPRARSLGEFRREVWTAGGYGQLVDRYPLV
ncbi:hypothetical protein SRB5_38730 [Streptomyces sp. RB5]|uniref:Uncharacterized protein n=1 Tax=Streptomyces smaragdinus TaxID=2585196 RepID=A0A7K0CL45_9ACTN|nr:hypothetical protein [Streptomyces smaragdinus]MQY13722.1 hypothetical protein [Streptomyces smaragdinus]